jgi:hypothetical protein
MTPKVPERGERILLVSATACEKENELLIGPRREIIKSSSGEDAIFRAKRSRFDLAVLISTGKNLDMVETVFNLRDARPSMPILIMAAEVGSEEASMIANACPNAHVLTSADLAAYIAARAGNSMT